MREIDLLDFVENEAETRGILFHHCRDSRSCEGDRGLPDLILVGSHKAAFWELKKDYGELKPGQTAWRYKLTAAGQDCRVVTPADIDRIPDMLDALNED